MGRAPISMTVQSNLPVVASDGTPIWTPLPPKGDTTSNITEMDTAYVVLQRVWRDDPNDYDEENPMPIFESGQPLHATDISVLGHRFTMWQQQHPEEIRAVLQDMVTQGGIFPITFPGPDSTTLPKRGQLIIAWDLSENRESFFGCSTIEE